MNEKAKQILDLATTAHREMRLDPAGALRVIDDSLAELRRVRAEAEQNNRTDIFDFADKAAGYLQSMNHHGSYTTAFGAGLDALSRAAENVRDGGAQ